MDKDSVYRVIHVIDDENIVINAGQSNGVKNNDRFQIYGLGDEMFDLDTDESLGRLELIRGVGVVVHVQDKMSIVSSDMYKEEPAITEIKSYPNILGSLSYLGVSGEERKIIKPGRRVKEKFNLPKIGDYARVIK